MPSGDPKEKHETSRSKRRKPHPKSPSKESLPESPSRPRKKAPLEASTAPTNSPGGLTASAKAKGKWLQGTVDSRRVRCLTPTVTVPNPSGECVVCFLQRDLRLQDNWALLFAQDAALSLKTPLHVLHLVAPGYCFQRTSRHLQFHLQGVKELAAGLAAHDISFHCFPVVATDAAAAEAEAKGRMQTALQELSPKVVVCDLMPLRRPAALVQQLGNICKQLLLCPLYQTDAHNIVPVWLASNKQEYAARTFRPHVFSVLADFGCDFPEIQRHPHKSNILKGVGDISEVLQQQLLLQADDAVQLPPQWVPGAAAGLAALKAFCSEQRLAAYAFRNNPLLNTQSGLSPWLHFGQLSAQRCWLAVRELGPAAKIGAAAAAARESFIEELVVRRELAENFTFYNTAYDEIAGAPKWAQDTLEAHRHDKREHVFSLTQFEGAKTYDSLWNAAQMQLVHDGKMHGFLRMYWAKKILEWSPSAEDALQTALHLNDKFSLDGTDPNGVVGCMWSVAGVHDQGWAERPVFGKIRYMNLAGCRRKFPVDDFVQQVQQNIRKCAKKEAVRPKNKQDEASKIIKETLAKQTTVRRSTREKDKH